MKENIFKRLTDEMYMLYTSCTDSGFNHDQAFELTKTYCTVAFARQSLEQKEISIYQKELSMQRLRERLKEAKDNG